MKTIKFKIDGRDCIAEKGQNLIEAAKTKWHIHSNTLLFQAFESIRKL